MKRRLFWNSIMRNFIAIEYGRLHVLGSLYTSSRLLAATCGELLESQVFESDIWNECIGEKLVSLWNLTEAFLNAH